MIIGIGIDIVEVVRFSQWHTYSYKSLSRIFSQEEIEYCFLDFHASAQRFAVRFAAREAFFKAFSCAFPAYSLPFLTMCRRSRIYKKNGCPYFIFDWRSCNLTDNFVIHVSLAHTKTIATAYVVLEKI